MTTLKTVLALLSATVILSLTASADEKKKKAPAEPKKPTLTYYYLPG